MTFTWSFPTDQSHNISNTWLLNQKLESRPRFCLIDVEYSIFYSDTKWNYHGGILMQKRLPNIQVLPKQQSILKIKKVWLLAWNKCTKWLSFQTMCLWVVFCVRPSMQYRKRLHGVYISMFCIVVALPINTRFIF